MRTLLISYAGADVDRGSLPRGGRLLPTWRGWLSPEGGGCEIRHSGLIVPSGDAVALAGAIAHLLKDPGGAKRMGLNGRSKVLSDHQLDRVCRQFLDLYGKVLLRVGNHE